MKLLSKKQLKERILYSYAHIDRKLNPKSRYFDPDFPKPVRVGNWRIGFLEDEVDRYIQKLLDRRRAP